MCGIAGFLDRSRPRNQDELATTVRAMAETLRHRGPDDAGVWSDAEAGVALGHQRLAIIDLSPAGRQPMNSSCGRFTIIYNGEIYNHADLRRELERCGHRFRGTSDTESLLEAIAEWGVERAVERSIGMFAFAVWDVKDRMLTLVRDRLGIKPLYYGWMNGVFLFGATSTAAHCRCFCGTTTSPRRFRFIGASSSCRRDAC
jgi:asparagine synthase (glutamine-hydrolysing)